jgi:UDP-N-acetyl-D-mannosaminuronic acid dehydrogenase
MKNIDNEIKNMRVCIIGLGQIGFPVAQYVAERGIETWGYDISHASVDRALKIKGVKATTKWGDIPNVDVYIVSVTTGQINDYPDVSAVFDVTEKIIKTAKPTALVSIESTIVPGTCKKIYTETFKKKISLVHCPHRYWPDQPIEHGVNQTRVIGGVSNEALKLGLSFYREKLGIPMFQVSSVEVAEMCKIAENSHRYVQIAYAEELKLISGKVGVNFDELRAAMNTKWNVDLPEARDGIGRHCLPKDIRYVMSLAPEEAMLLKCATMVDKKYRDWLAKQ